MPDKFSLKRTVQCAKCPWKTSTDPYDIPNNYSEEKHHKLASTIAEPGRIFIGGQLKVMSCHHSTDEDEQHCVGWLYHQMGEGNNIGLRMLMRNCSNISQIKIAGEQHQRFEDTLPQ